VGVVADGGLQPHLSRIGTHFDLDCQVGQFWALLGSSDTLSSAVSALSSSIDAKVNNNSRGFLLR
jgi:hypothetical protein